jgi:biotin-(acetyl-CoA carboxylase) ligase
VYCDGKKIAGILADTVVQGINCRVYLGVGINVNNDVSQDVSIAEIATSVRNEIGRPVDITEFTISLLKNLDGEYFSVIQSHVS